MLMPGTPPTHERFDFLRSIARMSHDDTVAHRERWPDLDWVWDELDELRAERDNAVAPEDLTAVEKERDEALEERDTALEERDKLADANSLVRAALGDVSEDDDLLAVIRAAHEALVV